MSAGGEGDVFGADVPVERGFQEVGDGLDEVGISFGRVVGGEHFSGGRFVVGDFLEAVLPDLVDGGDLCGLAAAEHFEVGAGVGEGVAEVVHEVADAAAAC